MNAMSAHDYGRDFWNVFTDPQMRKAAAFIQGGTTDLVFVIADVCRATGVKAEEMLGPCRKQKIARARWVAWHRLSLMGHSSVKIGKWFSRDHSTVLHGIARYAAHLETTAPKETAQ